VSRGSDSAEIKIALQTLSDSFADPCAKVRRRKMAIKPFSVIRSRKRAVLAKNPRSHSRSTTMEGG